MSLQSNIDYFGNAVNYAAKMQTAAGSGEIVLSDEFSSQPGIRDRLHALRLNLVETPFSLLPGEKAETDKVLLASLGK